MNQEYYEKMSSAFKNAQQPLQELAELNIKTIQSYEYLKPEDFTKFKKPDELFEKQLALAISNGHKALDYLKQSFEIIEKAMLQLNNQVKSKSDSKK